MENMGLDQTLKQLKSSLVMAQRRHEELELEKVQIVEQHKKAIEAVSIEGRLSVRIFSSESSPRVFCRRFFYVFMMACFHFSSKISGHL